MAVAKCFGHISDGGLMASVESGHEEWDRYIVFNHSTLSCW